MTEISIGEKEKWTNKGTDKQYVAVFCYTIQLITIKLSTKFQNPKSSSCLEIFDRKKKYADRQTNQQTDRQTNIITEKAKTIHPLYTSYRGHKDTSSSATKALDNLYMSRSQWVEGILSVWKIQACCIKDTSSSATKALDNLHMSRAQWVEGILSVLKIQACCIKDTSSSAVETLDNQHMSRAQ